MAALHIWLMSCLIVPLFDPVLECNTSIIWPSIGPNISTICATIRPSIGRPISQLIVSLLLFDPVLDLISQLLANQYLNSERGVWPPGSLFAERPLYILISWTEAEWRGQILSSISVLGEQAPLWAATSRSVLDQHNFLPLHSCTAHPLFTYYSLLISWLTDSSLVPTHPNAFSGTNIPSDRNFHCLIPINIFLVMSCSVSVASLTQLKFVDSEQAS